MRNISDVEHFIILGIEFLYASLAFTYLVHLKGMQERRKWLIPIAVISMVMTIVSFGTAWYFSMDGSREEWLEYSLNIGIISIVVPWILLFATMKKYRELKDDCSKEDKKNLLSVALLILFYAILSTGLELYQVIG